MSREKAVDIKKSSGKACFVYKGKSWCGQIISTQGDKRAKLDVPGLGKILVPYSRLDMEGTSRLAGKSGEAAPQKKAWPTSPSTDENYHRSKEAIIPAIPASKITPMQNDVKRMGECIKGMQSRRGKFSGIATAENDPAFQKDEECVRTQTQELLDRLNNQYGAPENYIDISGKRRSTGRGELHGYYKPGSTKIRVYPFTKAKEQVVAPKTFLKTVVHEWVHHYDEQILGLKSIHTDAFYQRVNTIYNQLKNVLETR